MDLSEQAKEERVQKDEEQVSRKRAAVIFSIPPHCFINFEIQGYYQNEQIRSGVYSKTIAKIKDRTYVINLNT